MADSGKIKPVKQVSTNMARNSMVHAEHAAPEVTLYGRIAGGIVGHVGVPKNDLHFTVVIADPYSGIFGLDGQPSTDIRPSLHRIGSTFDNFKLITAKFYYNTLPDSPVIKISISPPAGMSGHVFAQSLIRHAYNFASYNLPYSIPKHLVREVMIDGEYNSSSYVAGLLYSVMGYVPKIETAGYQTPGWDQPIPSSYFKGEAIR
jgi:hypothetical protein